MAPLDPRYTKVGFNLVSWHTRVIYVMIKGYRTPELKISPLTNLITLNTMVALPIRNRVWLRSRLSLGSGLPDLGKNLFVFIC